MSEEEEEALYVWSEQGIASVPKRLRDEIGNAKAGDVLAPATVEKLQAYGVWNALVRSSQVVKVSSGDDQDSASGASEHLAEEGEEEEQAERSEEESEAPAEHRDTNDHEAERNCDTSGQAPDEMHRSSESAQSSASAKQSSDSQMPSDELNSDEVNEGSNHVHSNDQYVINIHPPASEVSHHAGRDSGISTITRDTGATVDTLVPVRHGSHISYAPPEEVLHSGQANRNSSHANYSNDSLMPSDEHDGDEVNEDAHQAHSSDQYAISNHRPNSVVSRNTGRDTGITTRTGTTGTTSGTAKSRDTVNTIGTVTPVVRGSHISYVPLHEAESASDGDEGPGNSHDAGQSASDRGTGSEDQSASAPPSFRSGNAETRLGGTQRVRFSASKAEPETDLVPRIQNSSSSAISSVGSSANPARNVACAVDSKDKYTSSRAHESIPPLHRFSRLGVESETLQFPIPAAPIASDQGVASISEEPLSSASDASGETPIDNSAEDPTEQAPQPVDAASETGSASGLSDASEHHPAPGRVTFSRYVSDIPAQVTRFDPRVSEISVVGLSDVPEVIAPFRTSRAESSSTRTSRAESDRDSRSVDFMSNTVTTTSTQRARDRFDSIAVRYAEEEERSSQWINHPKFDIFFGAVIVLQAINLGIETELTLQSSNGKLEGAAAVVLPIFELFFTIIFLVELGLRLYAEGLAYLSCQSPFHIFDTFLVLFAVVDAIVSVLQMDSPLGMASSVRIFRLLRLVRIGRILQFCPELQVIVLGLVRTFAAAIWSFALLIVLCYCGALFCADLLGGSSDPDIQELFGSLPLSVLTHVKLAMIEAWPAIGEPMFKSSGFWRYYVALFICASNFALLNVVTGVVCERVFVVSSHLPPPDAQICAEKVENFKKKLRAEFDKKKSKSTYKDYIVFLRNDETQKLLHDFGISIPIDKKHLPLLLRERNDDGTDMAFDDFFNKLLRFWGSRNDCLSQSLQYDILRCDKAAMRRTRRMEKDLQSRMHAYITNVGEFMNEKTETVSSSVFQLYDTLNLYMAEPGEETPVPFTPDMLDSACAELESLSHDLCFTMARAANTISRLEQRQAEEIFEPVLDEHTHVRDRTSAGVQTCDTGDGYTQVTSTETGGATEPQRLRASPVLQPSQQPEADMAVLLSERDSRPSMEGSWWSDVGNADDAISKPLGAFPSAGLSTGPGALGWRLPEGAEIATTSAVVSRSSDVLGTSTASRDSGYKLLSRSLLASYLQNDVVPSVLPNQSASQQPHPNATSTPEAIKSGPPRHAASSVPLPPPPPQDSPRLQLQQPPEEDVQHDACGLESSGASQATDGGNGEVSSLLDSGASSTPAATIDI